MRIKVQCITIGLSILFLTMFFLPNYLEAQNRKISYVTVDTKNGLSQSLVICCYKDSYGYIWIGTDNGLNKWNGSEFEKYYYIKKDSTSLSNSYIWSMFEDSKKNLWIGTKTGLNLYNREKNIFERINYPDQTGKFNELRITNISEDKEGDIWFCTQIGVFQFNKKEKRFIARFREYFENKDVYCIKVDVANDGTIWVAYQDVNYGGIIRYNKKNGKITKYHTNSAEIKLHDNQIGAIKIDNENNLWVGYMQKGMDKINLQDNSIKSFICDNTKKNVWNNAIHDIVTDKYGNIYIAHNYGFDIYNPQKQEFTNYSSDETETSLKSNTIESLFYTTDGSLLIGTRGGGMSIMDNRLTKFIWYNHSTKIENSLNTNSVTAITEDSKGNILLGTDGGGINYFNFKTKTFKAFTSENTHNQLFNNKVLALAADIDNTFWAGMWQGGICHFEIVNEQFRLIKNYKNVDENDPNSNCVFKLHCSAKGDVWAGNFKTGVYHLNKATAKFERLVLFDKNNIPLPFVIITEIYTDIDNSVWIGTNDYGVFVFNPKNKKIEEYIYNEKDSTSIGANNVNVVFRDRKKRLWIGTTECGLSFFNDKTHKFKNFYIEDGLPGNSVAGIEEDNEGIIWISTNNGIAKVSIIEKEGKLFIKTLNYNEKDGLQAKNFNVWSYYKAKNGFIYFGGTQGFNVFHPDSIPLNKDKPTICFTDFLLFNKSAQIGAKNSPLKKHISETNEIILSYKQSVFTIKYSALNFILSEKNQYAYKLDNFEKTWNYVGNKNEATYTNLDPGEYVFRVKAANNDGIWNEEGISLKIIILPPFWKTFWFRMLVAICITGSALAFYRIRINRLKEQKDILETKVKERTLELQKTNILLKVHQEEIVQQNEEIKQQSEELVAQAETLVEQNKKLVELDKFKEMMTGTIVHDLKNPLNSIIVLSDPMVIEDECPPTTKMNLKVINQSGKQMLQLVMNILDVQKFENAKMKLALESESVKSIIDDALDQVPLLLENKNIKVKNFISSEYFVQADKNLIVRLFTNLLTNAIKFTNKEGLIKFEIAEGLTDEFLKISITDTGSGISAEKLPTIFEKFNQAEARDLGKTKSTGLGLAFCKMAAEAHGGSISVESTVGVGTTFYVELQKS